MARHQAFWVILAGTVPTAFRSPRRDDLLPTLHQLQRKQSDVTLQWFDQGKLWESPDAANAALLAKRREFRDRKPEWRPGGAHKDPRAKYQLSRDEKRARFKKRSFGRPPLGPKPGGPEGPGGPSDSRPAPPPDHRPAADRRPPTDRWRKPGGPPGADRWKKAKPFGKRPFRPHGDRPGRPPDAGDKPFGQRPPAKFGSKPSGNRPPGQFGGGPAGHRPPGKFSRKFSPSRPRGRKPPR